jgi:hypothetical protein
LTSFAARLLWDTKDLFLYTVIQRGRAVNVGYGFTAGEYQGRLAGGRAVIGDSGFIQARRHNPVTAALERVKTGERSTTGSMEGAAPGGRSTPRLAGQGQGGRTPPVTKKMTAGTPAFFLLFSPRPRGGGCPSPFEP